MAILAGVIIVTAVMDGGIIDRTQGAQTEYEIGQELETLKLAVASAYQTGGTIIEENLVKALDSEIGEGKYSLDSSNNDYFEVTILETKRTYRIYPNGKVEGPITGNVLGKAKVGIKVEINSTIDGKEYSSTNPVIPAGFTAVNMDNAKWDSENGPEVDNGLVIRDDSGNEFVWVPVEDEISTTEYVSGTNNKEPDIVTRQVNNYNSYDAISTNLQKVGCIDNNNDRKIDENDFKIQLQKEYKLMADSVNKYDGFYVGRFETSRNGSNPQSKRSQTASGSGVAIESAYNSTSENDWYGLYTLNKNYTTNSVQGSMLWGIQYDAMMDWMSPYADTGISGYNKNRTCGTAPEDVIKNVYDLYGNSFEWTLEKGQGTYYDTYDCRILRGGSYYSGKAPSTRGTYTPKSNVIGMPSYTISAGWNASRISLYIK